MHLVLGSTGSVGSAIVNEYISSGETVRALVRNTDKAKKVFTSGAGVEFVEGSVENPDTLRQAFRDVDIFYNCINLPYQKWSALLEIHGKILKAAGEARAKMVFPGNVYIYGHAPNGKVPETQQKNPCSRKGKIRLDLEDLFMKRSQEGNVPYVIVRFPDYYGPNTASIADGVFRSALKNKKARWFGKLDVLHEFIFTSDAAKAMIIASKKDEAYGQDFNVPGPEAILVRDFIRLIFQQAGFEPKMTGTGRALVRLTGLFNSLAREFAEMQYLAEEPLILDGSKFTELFGKYPTRSYADGIGQTLDWLKSNST